MPILFEKIITNKMKCISFPIREYWLDIGRMEDFNRAQEYVSFFDVYETYCSSISPFVEVDDNICGR